MNSHCCNTITNYSQRSYSATPAPTHEPEICRPLSSACLAKPEIYHKLKKKQTVIIILLQRNTDIMLDPSCACGIYLKWKKIDTYMFIYIYTCISIYIHVYIHIVRKCESFRYQRCFLLLQYRRQKVIWVILMGFENKTY